MGYDPTGYFGLAGAIIATGAIIGGLLGAFSAATTGGNVLEGAIEGIINGAIGSACGILMTNPLAAVVLATVGGFTVDLGVQAVSQLINTGNVAYEKFDIGRARKAGAQTGLGTAIPQFGNAAHNGADALGTAVIWAEGATIITVSDVIATNVIENNGKPSASSPKSTKQYKAAFCNGGKMIM